MPSSVGDTAVGSVPPLVKFIFPIDSKQAQSFQVWKVLCRCHKGMCWGIPVWGQSHFWSELHPCAGSWKVKWSCSVVSYSLQPTDCSPPSSFCPWDSPGKNTGVGCHLQADAVTSVPPGKPQDPERSHQIVLTHFICTLKPLGEKMCLKFQWTGIHTHTHTHTHTEYLGGIRGESQSDIHSPYLPQEREKRKKTLSVTV